MLYVALASAATGLYVYVDALPPTMLPFRVHTYVNPELAPAVDTLNVALDPTST
jgi:hypothetical protein